MKKKLFMMVLLIAFGFLAYHSLVFVPAKSGRTIDAISGAPVGEVAAARLIVGSIANLGDRREFYISQDYARSDLNGNFSFGRFIGFKNPLTDLREIYHFQEAAYLANDNSYPEYYPKIGLMLWQDQSIGLIPIVGTRYECQGNKECEKQFDYSQNFCAGAAAPTKDCRAFRAAAK